MRGIVASVTLCSWRYIGVDRNEGWIGPQERVWIEAKLSAVPDGRLVVGSMLFEGWRGVLDQRVRVGRAERWKIGRLAAWQVAGHTFRVSPWLHIDKSGRPEQLLPKHVVPDGLIVSRIRNVCQAVGTVGRFSHGVAHGLRVTLVANIWFTFRLDQTKSDRMTGQRRCRGGTGAFIPSLRNPAMLEPLAIRSVRAIAQSSGVVAVSGDQSARTRWRVLSVSPPSVVPRRRWGCPTGSVRTNETCHQGLPCRVLC